MTTKTKVSENLLRQLALMQHNDEPYFFVNGIAYEGKEDEAKENYQEDRQFHAEPITFAEWCADNCSEVVEFDPEDYGNDYMVLTDKEADEKAKEYILDSVWAFNPSFLASFTGFDIEVFKAIQENGRCESNNDAILSMINDKDEFVSDAISADGRGHFLAQYDFNENEETVKLPNNVWSEEDRDSATFYIYRIN